jgi:hypothetical protein
MKVTMRTSVEMILLQSQRFRSNTGKKKTSLFYRIFVSFELKEKDLWTQEYKIFQKKKKKTTTLTA